MTSHDVFKGMLLLHEPRSAAGGAGTAYRPKYGAKAWAAQKFGGQADEVSASTCCRKAEPCAC